MESTSFVALSRLATLRRQLSIIANNVANMNTTAFKSQHMMFTQYPVRSRGGDQLFGDRVSYVYDRATVRDFSEGAFQQTGNPLDMAIHGEGYFVVQTPNGDRYTRNGRFQLDSNGQLVTQEGYPVLSTSGQPFFFSAGEGQIEVARDGTVSARNGSINTDSSQDNVLGQLRIVRFNNPQQLQEVAGGMYTSTETPVDVTHPDVLQHGLEESNVEPIVEMTRLIDVNRHYQEAQQLINVEDDRMKTMITSLAPSTS